MSRKPNGSKKIACMIGQLTQGGSERQLYMFLKYIDRERWSPLVYVSRGPMGTWEDPIRKLGIPIILIDGNPVKRVWQFRQSCKANQIQRVFSWSAHTNVYALALLGLGIPCIGSYRSDFHAGMVDRRRWPVSWTDFPGIATVVCNSQETTAAVRSHVGDRKQVVYIPNGVQPIKDVALYRKTWRQRLDIQDDEVMILGVGRLTRLKNYACLIEAVARVNQTVPVRAIIAGRDDGCLEDLQQQVKVLGLEPGVVRFIGSVPEGQELMCAADVFVLSSDYEGMPNVILEAMAVGVPCVSTKVNGVSDLIKPGINGFVADHSADALADKIQLLAQDRLLRQEMGAKAKEHIASSFDPQMIAARLCQLLE